MLKKDICDQKQIREGYKYNSNLTILLKYLKHCACILLTDYIYATEVSADSQKKPKIPPHTNKFKSSKSPTLLQSNGTINGFGENVKDCGATVARKTN